MVLNPAITLSEAAAILGCAFTGDPAHLISGINEIHMVSAGDLTFVDVEKYYAKALNSAATTILINKAVEAPSGKGLLISDDPFRDYNLLTEKFNPRISPATFGLPELGEDVKIGRNVVFGENVSIGDRVEIGHNTVIGSGVTIGNDTIIYPNVTICDHTQIGEFVCINAGTVLGGEAFYFKARPYGRDKMLSKGRVIIGNHVDIGSNCTIDRGVSGDTEIGDWTKLDNLIQIGHDTRIGKKCILASQVGIAGVSVIEDEVIIWGQVGINKECIIGKGAVILAKTGVSSSLEGGKTYFGLVAEEARTSMKQYAALRSLPEHLLNHDKK